MQSQMLPAQYQQVQQLIFQQQQQQQQGAMNWARGVAPGRGRGHVPGWQHGGRGNPGPGEHPSPPVLCKVIGVPVRWSTILSEEPIRKKE